MCWPSTVPVQPEQLASAGFYHVGRNDNVKYFCCDGGLRCWERLKAGGEGDDRGSDGWMASPTQWT